jgi:hypothetical protein
MVLSGPMSIDFLLHAQISVSQTVFRAGILPGRRRTGMLIVLWSLGNLNGFQPQVRQDHTSKLPRLFSRPGLRIRRKATLSPTRSGGKLLGDADLADADGSNHELRLGPDRDINGDLHLLIRHRHPFRPPLDHSLYSLIGKRERGWRLKTFFRSLLPVF